MEKIPEHILEAINCGEINAADYYEKYGKEEIEAAIKEIKKSDKEILETVDSEKIYTKICASFEEKKVKNQKKYFPIKAIIPMAVAAVLVVMLLPNVAKNQINKNTYFSDETVRVKGEKNPKLYLYEQNEEKVYLLKKGAKVKNGALIQIAFNPLEKNYALIFSVDGNHQITNHFGNENFAAQQVENKINYLDFSYELDNAPDYEVFYLITSDSEFDFSKVAEELKNKSKNQLKSKKIIQKIVNKYLDCEADVCIFALNK